MPHRPSNTPEHQPEGGRDRILVAGGAGRALDLLRLATIRSDDVVLIHPAPEPAVKRFADLFAIEVHDRSPNEADMVDASVVLVAIGDVAAENEVVRLARRRGIPVHVADRVLVSDFDLLAFLEQRLPSALAA